MSDWKLNTPVAFLIFNRPDTTERVFDAIAKAKPPKLLVVADGPRPGRKGEVEKCAATREVVNRVNWDCEVLTNFSESNLGCKKRIASGIDWVFEHVPEAIILEDDCLPNLTFFRFCEEMLRRYRDDERISMISGSNLFYDKYRPEESYFFSRYSLIWGWATWRRAWKDYDVNMSSWPEMRDSGWYKNIGGYRFWHSEHWKKIFDDVYVSKIDTWDYQWTYANLVMNRFSIVSSVNLIDNIGIGPNATHTTELPTRWTQLALASSLESQLTHPKEVVVNKKADEWIEKRDFGVHYSHAVYQLIEKVPLIHRMLRSIKQLFTGKHGATPAS